MLRSAGKKTERNSNAVGMAQDRHDKMRAIMAHSYTANHLHIVFTSGARNNVANCSGGPGIAFDNGYVVE